MAAIGRPLPRALESLVPAALGSYAPAQQLLSLGRQRRFMADAPPAAKPAAPAGGKGGGGAGGKKKKGKEGDPTSNITFPQIKYSHGASTRPPRESLRRDDRTARVAALKASAATPNSPLAPLAPALDKLSGQVLQDDPVLKALLAQETASEGMAGPVSSEFGPARLAQAEEPSDLSTHLATEKALAHLGSDLPADLRAKLVASRYDIEQEMQTDVETDDEAGALYKQEYRDITKSYSRALPVVRSVGRGDGLDMSESAVEDMARALMSGVDLKKKMEETAAAIAQDAADVDAAAAVALRTIRDPSGRVRDPEEFMGLGRDKAHLVDQALMQMQGLDTGSALQRAREEAEAKEFMDDDPSSETFGTRLSRVGPNDPRRVPEGLLEDVLQPFDFTSTTRKAPGSEIETLREALMTPAERALNERRKTLRSMMDAPSPILYRPQWPLYAMITGVDQVRQVVSGGVIDSARCMVVVGNGMGGLGVGMVKHPDAEAACKKALQRAIRDMFHVNTHKGALYHDLIGKKNGVYVILRALPASAEIGKGGGRLVSDLMSLAGISKYSAKIVGSHRGRRNPYIVTQALFDAFNHHYPPEREAYLRGLKPVWATAARVTRHTVFPQNPKGPRYPAANHRVQDTGRARA